MFREVEVKLLGGANFFVIEKYGTKGKAFTKKSSRNCGNLTESDPPLSENKIIHQLIFMKLKNFD